MRANRAVLKRAKMIGASSGRFVNWLGSILASWSRGAWRRLRAFHVVMTKSHLGGYPKAILPALVHSLAIGFMVLGTVAFVLKEAKGVDLLGDLSAYALVLTFGSLVLYTYYTRRLAQADYEPLASFWLARGEENPLRINFMIDNHCKRPLDCWCEIEATVEKQRFALSGFYGKEYPFYVQPFLRANGNFNIEKNIVKRAGYNIEKLEEMESRTGMKPIHLKIMFGYGVRGGNIKWIAPVYYYFSVQEKKLVLDVGGAERQKCGIPS